MIKREVFVSGLKLLIEETFVTHHGIFTNRGTSIFETLENITEENASIPHGNDQETIAGHVFHMKFYLVVAQEYLKKIKSGHTNWDKSWVVKNVDAEQWGSLKNDLLIEYQRLMNFIDDVEDWNEEDYVAGVLGILAHNAFHLGAIRELNSIK